MIDLPLLIMTGGACAAVGVLIGVALTIRFYDRSPRNRDDPE